MLIAHMYKGATFTLVLPWGRFTFRIPSGACSWLFLENFLFCYAEIGSPALQYLYILVDRKTYVAPVPLPRNHFFSSLFETQLL